MTLPESRSALQAVRKSIRACRQRLESVPDCRNKSLALTHLDNAEILSESDHLDGDEERVAEAERFMLLAWGYEDRANQPRAKDRGTTAMRQPIKSEHWNDANGNPAGGCTYGTGFAISWQNGPLGRGDERREPNGAFVEGIIAAALDRLEYYQTSRFNSVENADAIFCLKKALERLAERTQDREQRAVEGTHTV